MKPKGLVIAISSIFVVCVATALAMGVARHGSLRISITYLIIFGLAIGLAVGLVRESSSSRWIAILFAAYGAVGIYLNSTKPLELGAVILGVAFSLCAIGLLTPFAGRHFARKIPAEQDGGPNPDPR